mgnify:CR=1 FL=1
MLTREETIKIFENCRCGAGDCNDCPMECDGNGNGFDELSSAVLHYLKEPKETEPAPAATGTSSEVSVKEDTDNIHFDNSVKTQICQEAQKAYKACELILDIYERMEDEEQKAFDMGQSYRAMLEVKEELTRIENGGDNNG